MVIVPYVEGSLHPEVVPAIEASGHKPHLFELPRSPRLDPKAHATVSTPEERAYYDLLVSLWNRTGEDLVIVEHDIVVGPDSIDDLLACRMPWCACQYQYNGYGLYAGLGCTRFSANCQARGADLFDKVATLSDPGHPPLHWCRLDGWIHATLFSWWVPEHIHQPPVRHLGHGVAHNCQAAGGIPHGQ